LVDFDEFALKLVQHGIVLGPDGNKMSKSKGNVINPDDVVKEFGTDAVRLYLSFMMPYSTTGPWSTTAMYGMFRFLKRVWDLQYKVKSEKLKVKSKDQGVARMGDPRNPSAVSETSDAGFGGNEGQAPELSSQDLFHMHTAIKKVTQDLEEIKNNTAVAALMKWLNYLEGKEEILEQELMNFLLILSPFAPHITEELWQLNKLTDSEADIEFRSIHQEKWPRYDDSLIVSDTVTIAVQVNGKLRDTIEVQSAKSKVQSEVEKEARGSEKIMKYLEGNSVKKVIYVPGKILNFVTTYLLS